MPSLSAMTKEKGKVIEKVMNKMSVQMLHYEKLKPSDMNFYSQTDIEELADSLALAGRILQPLIVRRTDIGEFEVLAGHRRRNAAIMNVQKGMKQFEFLPCLVLTSSDLEQMGDVHGEDVKAYLKYILIATNSATRELSEYERMIQTIQLEEILPKMRGDENLKGRALRAEIAKETKKSTGAIGTYRAIWKHLVPEYMNLFEKSTIGVSVAAGISGLDQEMQKKLFEEKHENVTLKDIELIKNAEKEVVEDKIKWELFNDGVVQEATKVFLQELEFASPDAYVQLITAYHGSRQEHNWYTCAENAVYNSIPFETEKIKVYRGGGYCVEWIQEKRAARIPSYYFWKGCEEHLKEKFVSESDTEKPEHLVNTKLTRIKADEKVCQKIMKLLCFDFPHVDELVSVLQAGDYQKAHEYFKQYLPYKNSCIEIEDVCGYDIKLLVSEEITVVSRRIFWEHFKLYNIHKFPDVEQSVDDVESAEDTEEEKPHDTSVYTPNPLSEHYEPLEGQLTTKDIGIEPDNDTVSDSDTPLVITGPESNFEGMVDEMMEYVCDKLCKYPYELDEEALEDKCANCKMGGYVCKILNKVR